MSYLKLVEALNQEMSLRDCKTSCNLCKGSFEALIIISTCFSPQHDGLHGPDLGDQAAVPGWGRGGGVATGARPGAPQAEEPRRHLRHLVAAALGHQPAPRQGGDQQHGSSDRVIQC